MTPSQERLSASAPGRVCLFGEHQDYLDLPVIPCAISRRITISGHRGDGKRIELALPDVHSEIAFTIEDYVPYRGARDYFRSAVNVLQRAGFTFSHGFRGRVRGDIPINSGTSSSSALVVAWVNLLARLSDQQRTLAPTACAALAHAAEVLEFHEPGGMMDHYATALGGVIGIEFHPELQMERLPAQLGTIVLGDSGEPKDTTAILARVKNGVLAWVAHLKKKYPAFSLHTVPLAELDRYIAGCDRESAALLWGTVANRDLTRTARSLLQQPRVDQHRLGALLNECQNILRDQLRISTPKIDRMLDAALAAGAYGGKINGSGGGGCMFVYAPEQPEKVAAAITAAGGKAHLVQVDCGTQLAAAESV